MILLLWSICTVCPAQQSPVFPEAKYTLALSPILQQESFNWSIAGNADGGQPDVYSELIWKKLSSAGAVLSFHLLLSQRFHLYSTLAKSSVISGQVSDKDYSGDGRTGESYAAIFDSDQGGASAGNLALGYEFLRHRNYKFSAYLGAEAGHTSLYLLDHSGKYNSDLRSTYKIATKGFIAGITADLSWSAFVFTPTVSFSALHYSAAGNWNLISQFKHPLSYRHRANASRWQINVRQTYLASRHLFFFLSGGISLFSTGKGVDILYLSNGTSPETQFNGAKGTLYCAGTGAGFSF